MAENGSLNGSPAIRRLTLLSTLALVLSPLGWASAAGAGGFAEGPAYQATIAFTPQLTPLIMTVTLAPTVPVPFQMQASPVPVAPTPVTAVGTPEPVRGLSGGDQTVGYDFLDGSEPPLWRIWFEGRELVVDPSDPGMDALWTAFLDQASLRAQADSDYQSAEQAIGTSKATTGFGPVGFVAGGIVAGVSCTTAPLTFWALGGTGWTCVLGILGAAAGLGAAVVSGVQWAQASNDKLDASERRDHAAAEAQSLFEALEQTAAP